MVTKKKKAKMGRPKEKPGDKVDLAMVSRLAEHGHTDSEIAHILGKGEGTLTNWKKDPDFLDALKKGKELPNNKVIQSLYKRAIGYTFEEVTREVFPITDAEGKSVGERRHIKTVTKNVAPDTGAAIFWLKNRLPLEWRDKHELVGDPLEPLYFKVVYDKVTTKSKK